MAVSAHKVFLYSVVLFWMFIAIYFFTSTDLTNSGTTDEIKHSMRIFDELQKQQLQLRSIAAEMSSLKVSGGNGNEAEGLLKSLKGDLSQCRAKSNELSQKLEKQMNSQARSQSKEAVDKTPAYFGILALYNQIQEISYYVKSRLKSLQNINNLSNQTLEELKNAMNSMKSRSSAALIEIELMKENEKGLHTQAMNALNEMVQRKIHQVQNPTDCSTAKKIVCGLTKSCGFGCQLHHVVYCLLIAIANDRTMILESKGWKYAPDGWESIFLNLSSTCNQVNSQPAVWKGGNANANDLVVSVPIIDSLQDRPSYLPLSIPDQLAPTLTMYHGNPSVWWIGQLVNYVMRPQPWISESIANHEKTIGFQHPIVGIHIRRTDKVGTEAAFHSIDEYMDFVIEWYDREDMKRQRLGENKISKRLVFIATDDPNVHSEAEKRYPDYKFLGDEGIARSAALGRRYTKSSLIGVISDIFLLSKCDYLVGTFSSQVSRAAYEIMQTLHPDAASYAHSLDDVFYFGGQHAHSQRALYNHEAKPNSEEISFQVGDTIGIAGNHWDGYSKGVNRRTGQVGLYPSYKVEEIINKVKFSDLPKLENIILNMTIREK